MQNSRPNFWLSSWKLKLSSVGVRDTLARGIAWISPLRTSSLSVYIARSHYRFYENVIILSRDNDRLPNIISLQKAAKSMHEKAPSEVPG